MGNWIKLIFLAHTPVVLIVHQAKVTAFSHCKVEVWGFWKSRAWHRAPFMQCFLTCVIEMWSAIMYITDKLLVVTEMNDFWNLRQFKFITTEMSFSAKFLGEKWNYSFNYIENNRLYYLARQVVLDCHFMILYKQQEHFLNERQKFWNKRGI